MDKKEIIICFMSYYMTAGYPPLYVPLMSDSAEG